MMTPLMMLQQSHSVVHAASPEARAVADLWWWMLAAGGAVWMAVTAMTLVVAFRRRRTSREDTTDYPADIPDESRRGILYTVTALLALTAAVLLTFLVYDFGVGRRLVAVTPPGVTISVVGHQWWWEFTYENSSPDLQVIVANELHVPVGTPVRFLLNAHDVIHSFWLPSMSGKRDLVPGRQATLQFQADTVGTYRGQCAEFCGLQHAKMAFSVVAEHPDEFNRWLEHQREPASAVDSNATTPIAPPTALPDSTIAFGREVFLSRSCATCHTIRGTDAAGRTAPDLTHFGSRLTIAAGAVRNTADNLAFWITSPNRVKPGTQMPSTPLTNGELKALTAYIETLR